MSFFCTGARVAMNLPKVNALMAILAIQTPLNVLEDLLATSPFTVKQKEGIKSSIDFLLLLKKQMGTNKLFFEELKQLLSICNHQDLVTTVIDFDKANPGWFSEKYLPDITECIRAGKPQQNQISRFRKALFGISQTIRSKDLNIMIGVSPVPESSKEEITTGNDLFEALENHGCINENDTELLQQMLEHLHLSKPLKLLHDYQSEFQVCASSDISQQSEGYSASLQMEAHMLPPPVTETIGPDSSYSLSAGDCSSLCGRSMSTFTFLCSAIVNHFYSPDERFGNTCTESSDDSSFNANTVNSPTSSIVLIPTANSFSTLADLSQTSSCHDQYPITCECSQKNGIKS